MKNNDSAMLTILVSFYNAEQYVTKCIQNLKVQTNYNFVCILVDDGSSDGSFALAQKEIAKDRRFSLIRHEKNTGLGAGRTSGIQKVSTEFLTFIDADDELEHTAVETILNNIEKQDADLYVYDYCQKNEKGDVRRVSGSAQTVPKLFLQKDGRISHVWHKVFRTSLFKKIDLSFYRTITFAEDLFLCVHAFMKSQKTVLASEAYYYYLTNGSSLVHSRSEKSFYDNAAVMQSLLSTPDLPRFPEIAQYLEEDSFNTFGQFIFPNRKNPFQWEMPHFEEWRRVNEKREIFIPKNANPLAKCYIRLIKKRRDFLAKMLWRVLKLRELTRK